MTRLLSRMHEGLNAFERDRTGATLRLARAAVPLQLAVLVGIAASRLHAGSLTVATLVVAAVVVSLLLGVGRFLLRHNTQRERMVVALGQAALTVLLVEVGGGSPLHLGLCMVSLALLAMLDDWHVTALYAAAHTIGVFIAFSADFAIQRVAPTAGDLQTSLFTLMVAVPVSLRCYLSARERQRLSDAARWLEEQFESVQELEIAEQANQAKTEFLANMSHEIRTPLTAIRGFADLIGDPDITDDERHGYILTIRRNTDHLLTIINDILDLSKIEAGKMSVEALVTEPAAIVSDVLALMRVRAAEKNLSFGARYETPVPSQVTTDPTRLRQILVNLVSNAIKFTSEGGVEIRVRFDNDSELLHFEVRDSGIGLTDDQRNRLFEAFSQADTSTTRKFGGTGLGLVISQKMAQMLGGRIDVESEIGVGSSFIATIATGDVSETPRDDVFVHTMQRASDTMVAARAINCTGARVLLAEDGLDNQRLIGTLIRKCGAELEIVDNGADALAAALRAAAAGTPYHVVFMDMQMPIMDGYTATRTLRERDYAGPIVALTAHAMATERQRCLDAGCSAFLSKPVDRYALLDTIRTCAADAIGAAAPSDTSASTSGRDPAEHRARRTSLQLPVLSRPEAATEPEPTTNPPTEPAPEATSTPAEPIRSTFEDDPDYAPLIVEFVAGLRETMVEIEGALASGDLDRVRSLAHQIKGAGGGYGFDAVTDVARDLEHAASSGDDVSVAAERFSETLARVTAPDLAQAA